MYGKTSAKQEVRANFSKVDLDSSKNHTVVLILGKHFKQALVEIASCKKPICKRSWQPKMNSQRNCQIQIQTNLTRGVCKSTKLLKQDTNLGVILCRATVIVQLPFNTLWINSRGQHQRTETQAGCGTGKFDGDSHWCRARAMGWKHFPEIDYVPPTHILLVFPISSTVRVPTQ